MPTLNFLYRFIIIYMIVAETVILFMISYLFNQKINKSKFKVDHLDKLTVFPIREEPEKEEHPLDDVLADYSVNLDDRVDDSVYETNIMRRLSDMKINVYYSNYTSSNVLVKGRRFGEYSIEIASPKSTSDGIEEKTISAWEETEEYGIRYAIRLVVSGTNFLIWGKDREDALLNLITFAAEFECNYA